MKSCWSLAFLAFLFVLTRAQPAAAYPWLIGHGYASCGACHVDPSGGTQLTAYGRGMSDLIVRWHVDAKEVESGEPSTTSGFLFGLVPLPDWFSVSGNLRGGGIAIAAKQFQIRPILMASDVAATLDLDWFVAHVSLGYGLRAVGPAVVISPDGGPDNAFVSREHWIGFRFLDQSLVVRAGRIPVPFGLRNNEHTSFVREVTRTGLDLDQQHGVTISYANDFLRTEVMGIAGNYQLQPDAVRERGYSGYLEFTPIKGLGVGASSLVTFAQQDILREVPLVRQVHGVFARYAPLEEVVLLAEVDALINHPNLNATEIGGAGWLQLDFAPIQGVHLMPAVEALFAGDGSTSLPTLGGWGSVAWYCLPHTELRFDAVYRETFPVVGLASGVFTGLLQLHLWL